MTSTESCDLDVQMTWMSSLPDARRSGIHEGLVLPSSFGNYPFQYTRYDDSSSIDQQHRPLNYYANCLLAGAASSSVRWILTPLDLVKTQLQTSSNSTKYTTIRQGLSTILREQGYSGLYRGFLPTILSYSSQSGTKYALYECFKHQCSSSSQDDPNHNSHNTFWIHLISAASAEAIADVFMCPWEMIKVKMQTSPQFPSRIGPAIATLLLQTSSFPFGALRPLWSRQILFTTVNFAAFEQTRHYLQSRLPQTDANNRSTLLITLGAGFVSGSLATIASHPADSLLSLTSSSQSSQHQSYRQIIERVGWKRLLLQGLGPRVALTGTTIAVQWLLYDSCKNFLLGS